MLGKFKQVGNDVKKTVAVTKVNTEIDIEYFKAKAKSNGSGFDHPKEVAERIKTTIEIQSIYEELLACVEEWETNYKAIINCEMKNTNKIKERSAQHLHPNVVLAKYSKKFLEYQKEIHQLREIQLAFVLEHIQLPVKKFLSDNQHFKSKIEQLNKSYVEVKYWKAKANVAKFQEAQTAYESHSKKFLIEVDELRELAEKDYPQKLGAFQQAQNEFFYNGTNLSNILENQKRSSSNVSIGRVQSASFGSEFEKVDLIDL